MTQYKIFFRMGGVGMGLIGIFYIYLCVQGFIQLIKNQTAGVIAFYGLTTILIIRELTGFLKFNLDMVFNKGEKNEWKRFYRSLGKNRII